jgi:ubiquinone/menaquinone biosynthesis C-methylase UbiE
MPNLANLDVVESYRASHRNDSSDKLYPNLMLVRSLPYLSKGQKLRILDYGCGYGANSLALNQYSNELVYADTCEVALKKTSQKLSTSISQSNVVGSLIDPHSDRLPFNDGAFDLIVCASVLSLLSEKAKVRNVLAEFYRVLSGDGRVFLDINGPKSEFAVYSDLISEDTYSYMGRSRDKTPIQVYCPVRDTFEMIASEFFKIDEIGETSHDLLRHKEQEFIVLGSKLVK